MAQVATPTLYGFQLSPYVQRVQLCLHELGLDEYDLVPVNPMKGEGRLPEHLDRSPLGKVPAYSDGDVTISESRAICRYLAEKHGPSSFVSSSTGNGGVSHDLPDLLGADVVERARVNQWVDIEATSFNPVAFTIVRERLVKPLRGATPDEAVVKDNEEKLAAMLDRYEAHLVKTGFPYLAGERYTLADLTHIPVTALLKRCGLQHMLESRPHVREWWARLASRPAWQKVKEKFSAAMAAMQAAKAADGS